MQMHVAPRNDIDSFTLSIDEKLAFPPKTIWRILIQPAKRNAVAGHLKRRPRRRPRPTRATDCATDNQHDQDRDNPDLFHLGNPPRFPAARHPCGEIPKTPTSAHNN